MRRNDGDADPRCRVLAKGHDAELFTSRRFIMFGSNPFKNELGKTVVLLTIPLGSRVDGRR